MTSQDTPEADAAARAVADCATPVTVVTSRTAEATVGQTISAFAPISNEPAVVMVAIHRRSPINAVIAETDRFRVNVLATSHDHVADTFAGRPWDGKDRYDFTCGTWELADEYGPVLTDANASFGCVVLSAVIVGEHTAYFGEICSAKTSSEVLPLMYLKRVYRQLAELPLSTFPDFPHARPPYQRSR